MNRTISLVALAVLGVVAYADRSLAGATLTAKGDKGKFPRSPKTHSRVKGGVSSVKLHRSPRHVATLNRKKAHQAA